jgi:hypothetical protein
VISKKKPQWFKSYGAVTKVFFSVTQKATYKHHGINDIKEKEHLPIFPLATLLLSRESGRAD